MSSIKHFLDIHQIPQRELHKIIAIAQNLKSQSKAKEAHQQHTLLAHRQLAMIFEKPSTRTRISFEVGINQLGGSAIVMQKTDMQLGKGETIEDTSRVLSRYIDIIMIRCHDHKTLTELAKHSTAPVINALTNHSHPCQIMASILTITERLGSIKGKKLVWIGDDNNVLNSYIHAAKPFEYELVIATPEEYPPHEKTLRDALKAGAAIHHTNNPQEAAKDADVIITDTWISMGDTSDQNNAQRSKKLEIFKPYQVTSEIMGLARPSAIFTHCLPAYRGFEVAAQVIDGEQSVVFDEAENRLHIQKAIMLWCLS